jgi:uroporphyrinogen decarboxylase
MNPKKRVRLALAGQQTDRPLFSPAIYEHKAKLLGKSPSEVSQSAELLEQAVLAEYETYGPDLLTVGIDVYNIEAETLGSRVVFPEAIDAVPAIKKPVLADLSDLDGLPTVNPASSGRMPVVLNAAKAVNDKLSHEVFVRGAISAPYSMAAELLGIEKLLIASVEQPSEVNKLLTLCCRVSTSYGWALLARDVEVCVFDSYAATPLISPDTYKDLVLPHTRKLVHALRDCGAEFVEYVIGGQTGPIAEHLFATGADIVLSDFASDINVFLERAGDAKTLVRRNISPILIERGPDDDLAEQIAGVVQLAAKHKNVIIGTGALSYNTPVERVLTVKEMCLDKYRQCK